MNIGQISDLPTGAVVETRCRFDGAGVHPFASPMPAILKILTLPHVLRQEAIIDIALSGSFDEMVALVVTDPMCCRLTPGQGREMMKEMLSANREWIQNPRLLEF
jgi:alpha-galactosidase/6-phospho-beta-glucosidase family protein